ncbi:MAG: hypothetical protein IPM46_11815 [Flavobacteriales bacterium]|nr:hypothetical protein [Flavobacteriales bacterium]
MKSDIRTADDIDALVRAFYERARPDPVIGHFFVDLDWKHLSAHHVLLVHGAFRRSRFQATP